ncbi:hypothetical protein [Yersinia pekkanenii]|uniref:Phage-like protein n=1 Tax=Yersinia pekkanenii TaxID=1288385 RepID=A0A0T9QH15_9GAMM|nr:hypothetical protein [Yersinia pekkanenii]CNI11387.1 phage-like protein [Yersinia pekkanenii]CRY69236.1 phage-like protein [Yersinia pekkanenii]
MRELWSVALPLIVSWLLGWAMHGESQSKIEQAINQLATENRLQLEGIASTSARQLENRLTELRANEVHTERLIRTEIIKPVFSNVCASDDYVRLFNAGAESAERTLSGKPVNPLSGNAAAPDR